MGVCKSFTDQENKEALFSIPNHKSPGPDGYSSGFFKHMWQHAGHLVCTLIRDFFHTTTMPPIISATKLVLIPKTAQPRTAADFRPISCCNALYKVISKLLCKSLKEVLPSIIDPCQGAFVPGCEIIYDVLICQDLARGYPRPYLLAMHT